MPPRLVQQFCWALDIGASEDPRDAEFWSLDQLIGDRGWSVVADWLDEDLPDEHPVADWIDALGARVALEIHHRVADGRVQLPQGVEARGWVFDPLTGEDGHLWSVESPWMAGGGPDEAAVWAGGEIIAVIPVGAWRRLGLVPRIADAILVRTGLVEPLLPSDAAILTWGR